MPTSGRRGQQGGSRGVLGGVGGQGAWPEGVSWWGRGQYGGGNVGGSKKYFKLYYN